ncbi:unnamed protein product, partial [Choristocarpus tenellus]
CQVLDCSKLPRYAKLGHKAQFCATHKVYGMVDVKHPRCEELTCTRQPTFGHEGEKACYCSAHKKTGMVDVKVTATTTEV